MRAISAIPGVAATSAIAPSKNDRVSIVFISRFIGIRDIHNLMTERDSEVEKVSRRLEGDRAIIEAVEVAREFGAQQWLSEDELARLCILVEEWVANLYDHGSVRASQSIKIEIEAAKNGLLVAISDPGKPFDPCNLPLKLARSAGGAGAGINLMKAWAIVKGYEIKPTGNRLVLLFPVVWAD
jgi:anti-sigma regulatory factor (Ser/Thr protein kinase)